MNDTISITISDIADAVIDIASAGQGVAEVMGIDPMDLSEVFGHIEANPNMPTGDGESMFALGFLAGVQAARQEVAR